MVDLNQMSDEDIKNKAGDIASFCFAFKHVWNLTRDKIKAIFEMCWQDGSSLNYYEDVSILSRYMLQAADYQKEEFVKIESEVIKSKEDQIMKSTYDRLIDEGMERGIEKGMERGIEKGQKVKEESVVLNMLKKKIDVSTIMECTGVSKEQVLQLQKSL